MGEFTLQDLLYVYDRYTETKKLSNITFQLFDCEKLADLEKETILTEFLRKNSIKNKTEITPSIRMILIKHSSSFPNLAKEKENFIMDSSIALDEDIVKLFKL